ncbi:toxin-antitoxin system HicB family antitoxin [Demequina aestuarii]|uniref:toxin-antitoxin system HicB family antitoxin n=1 Tax=Demequina aestuarii TaxID=327095 RepID=UPI000783B451|nr:toxin-antitoxin system HicB family antitoxin [Demequina aestuarii]
MDLAHYSAQLRQQLEASAAAGTPKVREAAAQLATALDPAVRLAIVEALAEAASEISREIEPGGVDLRVRGKDVRFVVTVPHAGPAAAADAVAGAQAEVASLAGDPASRTTLRIPDSLKERAEAAAAAEGISLNSWLVRAVSLHLEPSAQSRRGRAGARMVGWADQPD